MISLEETKCKCQHNLTTAAAGVSNAPWSAGTTTTRAGCTWTRSLSTESYARRQQWIVTRHDDVANFLTTRLRGLPMHTKGDWCMQEPPAPAPGLAGASADLTEVKVRKWLIVVCPAKKSVVERQRSHGVAAKAGEALKRRKYVGAVRGFVVESGGRFWTTRRDVHRRGGGR